jgi:hypothetical protein
MINKFSFFLLILSLLSTTATASSYYPTYSVTDGIEYLSNHIDPFNSYDTDPKDMFRTLLRKYDLVTNTNEQELSSSSYVEGVKELLSSENHTLKADKYSYNYGTCETNEYPSALSFMEEVVKELGSSPNTDRLIVARHHLLNLCNREESHLLYSKYLATNISDSYFDEYNTILRPLRRDERYAPWVEYLDGAIHFYQESFEKAKARFAYVKNKSTGWLNDTSAYMAVRILKAEVSTWVHDDSKDDKFKRVLSNLETSIQQYQQSYSDGRYVETVRNLDRFVAQYRDDRHALVTATHRTFNRIFSPRAMESTGEFLYEAIDSTEAIFEMPQDNGINFRMHPLAVVANLLREVANKESNQEKSSPQIWRDRFYNGSKLSENYSGLAKYFELLLLAHAQNFREIAVYPVRGEDFGPLYADALILQARSLERLNLYMDAANLWLTMSKKFPVNNYLIEIASAYVRVNKFSDFAKIEQFLINDLSPMKLGEGERLVSNSDKKPIYSLNKSYLSILRRGFEVFVSPDEAALVFSDANLNPAIRFLAAEPILRTSLLEKNYSVFLSTAIKAFGYDFSRNKPTNFPVVDDNKLIEAYRNIIPHVKTLASNPNDPDALTALGYFLYSEHRFPICSKRRTLWEKSWETCGSDSFPEYHGEIIEPYEWDEKTPESSFRPVEFFSKALSIYKSQSERNVGEAKVLRILILCFKGRQNPFNCVRGLKNEYPESLRKGYFERLHKYFPQEAKKTRYWY